MLGKVRREIAVRRGENYSKIRRNSDTLLQTVISVGGWKTENAQLARSRMLSAFP
jgi:hypothetical protein